MIRQGKGKKDRTSRSASARWPGSTNTSARRGPNCWSRSDDGTVFLSSQGGQMDRVYLTGLVRSYVRKAKIGKKGGCHLFRHTVATLMLENGADIRVIQEMLGHAKITTTELYTRVSINLLKQVYSATHPAAHLGPRNGPATARDAQAEAELFDALAAEDEDNDA